MAIDEFYMRRAYGDRLDWLDHQNKFAHPEDYLPAPKNHGLFVETQDEGVQSDSGPILIEKDNLPFNRKMGLYLKEFTFSTSAHGIPMIGQITEVMHKYNQNDKIVDIQLIFEAPAFPAITLCNLNPYRRSAADSVTLVKKTLKAFDDVMKSAGEKAKKPSEGKDETKPAGGGGHHRRIKRSGDVNFEVALTVCDCSSGTCDTGSVDNDLKAKSPEDGDELCYCAFDRLAGDAFPCYPKEKWSLDLEDCKSCNDHGWCNLEAESAQGDIEKSCMCQSVDANCIAHEEGVPILNLWEFYGQAAPTEDPAFLEALGFTGMTDEVAIVTKAKENIVFAMSTLDKNKRMELSYSKQQFVHKCSFNGKQCDIEQDFLIFPDPNFGNCFTFNHNISDRKQSARAGPMYGLRLIVFVNVTEYLPTTEAAGVKLTIHEKPQVPFPDIFGYNAPVGYISSFGIKAKRVQRLGHPFGDCVVDGKDAAYIYTAYEYSTEGCFRSCFQKDVISRCGCGDPRFPVPPPAEDGTEYRHCQAVNPSERRCLDGMSKTKEEAAGDEEQSRDCICRQSCFSSFYTVTYSASQWPSPSLQVQLGLCDKSHAECVRYYRDNGAMLEVFFDQLNYEYMSESAAYGFANLLADFGGQFGLWLGVSVITCCEFAYLLLNVGWMVGQHQYELYKRQQRARQIALEEG